VATKKLYFKIGEACKKLDIQPYVLRYWETEFPALSPNKSKSGQRVYTAEDLQVIGRIKELLYEEGFTIAGAKKKLEAELKTGIKPPRKGKPEVAEEEPEEAAPEPGEPAATGDTDEAAEPVVDEAAKKELEQLRAGVEKAVTQAREIRDVAQPGSAPEWGSGGREFKSRRPDHLQ
jgi:DNA-binding transcriptional MerR regulator